MYNNYQPTVKLRLFGISGILLFLFALSAQAQTIKYVKQGGTGAGTSWADASGNLQAMIDASEANGQVWVAAGTYIPTLIPDDLFYNENETHRTFLLKNNVEVYGGFAAAGNPVFTDRDWVANTTILSGELGSIDDDTDNVLHVVLANGTPENPLAAGTILDGFSITGGSATDNPYILVNNQQILASSGAGIYLNNANVTLSNLVIGNNYALQSGGGIYSAASSPVFSDSFVSGNTAALGAGMYNEASSPQITGVSFTQNTTFTMYSYGTAGGMANNNSNVTLTNVDISENITGGMGGGMYNIGSTITMTNVTVNNNILNNITGEPVGGSGGGIYNYQCTLNITGGSVNNNITVGDGGGIYNSETTLTITGTNINNNTGGNYGGGIYGYYDNSITITNANINGNTATIGGGIYSDLGNSLALTNTNVNQNSAQFASAIYTTYTSAVFTYNGGTVSGNITTLDAPDNMAIITGAGTTITNVSIINNQMGGLRADAHAGVAILLDGLTISGNSVREGVVLLPWNQDDNSSITFTNSLVNNNTAGGILIQAEENLNILLDNITISGNSSDDVGAGLRVNSSALYILETSNIVVNNCTITNNTSTANYGGGVSCVNVPITFTNSTVSGNTSAYGGGGMYNDTAPSVLTNITFENNSTPYNGGGLCNIDSPISGTNITFNQNTALRGGAMYSNGAPATFTDCTVINNSASYGAGLYNGLYANTLYKNLIVKGNTSENQGGGIYNINSSPIFINAVISGNTATNRGGGIYNSGNNYNPAFTNATVSGNNSAQGANMFNIAASPIFNNSVIWNTDGGGVYNNSPSSTPQYYNSLVKDATTTANGNIDGATDPLFLYAPAATLAPFTNGNYSLQSSSPLLNSGSNTAYTTAGGTLETDLDLAGNSRVYDLANGGTIDIGAYEYEGDPGCLYNTIWSGSAWSNGIPTSYEYAAIINGDYTSAGDITACSLTVYDADVTVQTGDTFYIKGTIAVNNANATLTVQNNGAIVQTDDVANGGNIVFHKLANPLTMQKQTLWSSPVTGQNLADFSPDSYPGTFWQYISQLPAGLEGPGYYSDVNATTTNFEPGKGILIGMPLTISGPNADAYAANTYAFAYDGTFTGTPYNGTINAPLNTNGDLFTAIGNPYPSPLGITDFFNAGQEILDPSAGIYLWSVSNNAFGYSIVTATSFVSESPTPNSAFTGNPSTWAISPGQGFLVQSAGVATSFPFTNNMRRGANASQPFFRQASSTLSRLWLGITSETGPFMQTSIAYSNDATTGLDYGMEAKMFGLSSANKIYSIAQDTNLAIQTRPGFEASDIVPIGFEAPVAGTYTITLNQFDGVFADGQDIYIKDYAQNALVHNLKLSPYTFSSQEGIFNTRFEIVYTNALGVNNISENNVIVYKNNESLHIDAGTTLINSVSLFDVSGRKLYSQHNINAATVSIDSIIAKNQVLIAEITTEHGIVKKKILF